MNEPGKFESCVKPRTIDEYIAAQDAEAQPRLREVRDILRAALPERAGFHVSKGTIRLPLSHAMPADLIARIARWCYEEYGK